MPVRSSFNPQLALEANPYYVGAPYTPPPRWTQDALGRVGRLPAFTDPNAVDFAKMQVPAYVPDSASVQSLRSMIPRRSPGDAVREPGPPKGRPDAGGNVRMWPGQPGQGIGDIYSAIAQSLGQAAGISAPAQGPQTYTRPIGQPVDPGGQYTAAATAKANASQYTRPIGQPVDPGGRYRAAAIAKANASPYMRPIGRPMDPGGRYSAAAAAKRGGTPFTMQQAANAAMQRLARRPPMAQGRRALQPARPRNPNAVNEPVRWK